MACDTSTYVVHDAILYYISGKDVGIRLRLFEPIGLRAEILKQCHERMGHMGVAKTYDLIGVDHVHHSL